MADNHINKTHIPEHLPKTGGTNCFRAPQGIIVQWCQISLNERIDAASWQFYDQDYLNSFKACYWCPIKVVLIYISIPFCMCFDCTLSSIMAKIPQMFLLSFQVENSQQDNGLKIEI